MTGPETITVGELIRQMDTLNRRVEAMDGKLDGVVSTVDQARGVLAFLRWIGLGAIFAAGFGIAKFLGVL